MNRKYIKEHSHGIKNSENIVMHGDNRAALSVLHDEFKGKIRCIYIDPPYNNGESYSHYHDRRSHEQWIKEITETLTLLRPLLAEDGSIWMSIDDNEMHYLKIVADNIFGRTNFLATVVWQHRNTRENRSIFSKNHEYILVYAKNPREFKLKRNLLPSPPSISERYKNPDNDSRGLWQSISANVQAGHATKSQFYELSAPNGKKHLPPKGRCWVYNKVKMQKEIDANNIWFGKDGNAVPRIKKFLNSSKVGLTPETLWLGNDVGTNKSAKKHLLEILNQESLFDTPKPEELIYRILQIATNENDFVLDCYLGSGSTISTAHKINRKYIGIEIGEHIVEHVVSRLKKVIHGEQGGISKEVQWKGGGGFNFYRLPR